MASIPEGYIPTSQLGVVSPVLSNYDSWAEAGGWPDSPENRQRYQEQVAGTAEYGGYAGDRDYEEYIQKHRVKGPDGKWLLPKDAMKDLVAMADAKSSELITPGVAAGLFGAAAGGIIGGAALGGAGGADSLAAGAFDMGGLSGTGIPEAWGITGAAPGATVGAEFVDPWDLMGDPSSYGLNAQGAAPAAPTGTAAPQSAPAPQVGQAPQVGPETFVDNWDVMGNPASYGMGSGPSFNPANVPTPPRSMFDDAKDWLKGNQTFASGALSTAGGLIKGAMADSPEDIARARYKAQLEAEMAMRDRIRADNNLANINVNRLKPTGAVIRRPSGIIAGAMNPPTRA